MHWYELVSVFEAIETWVVEIAGSLWAYPAMFALASLDAFFPPLPGESVVITLTVASRTTGCPLIWAVFLVAVAAAWCGDQLAFQIGRTIGTERVPFLRSEKGRRSVEWARRMLSRRGATFVIAARYIPMGRVAVNVTAGAVGYSRRRFMVFSAVGAVLWASNTLVIGLGAAAWLGENLLLAMAVGVALGVVTGFAVDPVLQVFLNRRGRTGSATPGARPRAGRGVVVPTAAVTARCGPEVGR